MHIPAVFTHNVFYFIKSLSIAFLAISIDNFNFVDIVSQNGRRRPFWMPDDHFLSHSDQYATFFICSLLFSQNGHRQLFFILFKSDFWMPVTYFYHISQNTTLFLIFSQNVLHRPF